MLINCSSTDDGFITTLVSGQVFMVEGSWFGAGRNTDPASVGGRNIGHDPCHLILIDASIC